jgi:two-component sensor histidine kinase
VFVNFSVKDGLPTKFIYSAAQDKKGYMWFGTASGLYRYDGHLFKAFRSTADIPGRTIANILQTVATDDAGNLWLGSLNTLQWYNPVSNTFWTPDYKKPMVKKLCDAYTRCITKGSNGVMWLATTGDYFYKFNPSDSSFTHFGPAYPSSASIVCIRLMEAAGHIWAVHKEGLYEFSYEGTLLGFYPCKNNDLTNGCHNKEQNHFWLSTSLSGVFKFSLTEKKYEPLVIKSGQFINTHLFCIVQGNNRELYMGGYPFFKIDIAAQKLYAPSTNKENEYNLGVTKVVELFFDREQNLWLCSHNGLSMMPWQNGRVKTIPLKDRLQGNLVEPQGAFGVPGTNNLLVLGTNTVGLLYYDAQQDTLFTVPNRTAPGKAISGLVEAPDGTMFLSDDTHFFKFLPVERKLVPHSLKDQQGKDISKVWRSTCNGNGMLFIGTTGNGFYTWQYPAGKLIHYNKWDIDPASETKEDNELYPVLTDSKNSTWFTSNSGVYQYQPSENKYLHHAFKEQPGVTLPGRTSSVAEDNAGHYWISTISNGLYEMWFEGGREILKNYTIASGISLPSDYNLKIKKDKNDGSLWINNLNGLLHFNPATRKVMSIFDKQNGFSGDGGGYTFSITPQNTLARLFYGSMDLIDLNRYTWNTHIPEISFNSVKIMDREMVGAELAKNPYLAVDHQDAFLRFEFTALLFNNGNRNQYAYMLSGADKDWIYSGTQNSVAYSGLKPGTYYFRVKAANNDGIWGPEKKIEIRIKPPFYTTWWFIALCIAAIAFLFFGWNRYKINQARREEKLKASFAKQIAETEMKALRAQMNPHFIFNSLNSIQKYILKNENFQASQYLTRFSRLIRLILDHSNQNTILLSSELDLLKLYVEMESLRFDNKFDYSIRADENINAETLELPSMLIQPFVENAIWHGLLHLERRGKLDIHFARDGNNLTVTIDDDGVGRAKAGELKSKQVLKKKSYGMQITEDRIEIINRTQHINATCEIIDKTDATGQALGTTVRLTIPVKPLKT